MDASYSPAEAVNAADNQNNDDKGGSLETVELELALQFQNFIELGFEGSVQRAIESVGGRLLFQMRLDGAEDCERLAAVAVESGGQEKFALILLPPGGGSPRVEAVETSTHPVARIAAAYAGLMDHLDMAA